jgi:DNA repair exonuclease SbcCD ATPase subunit
MILSSVRDARTIVDKKVGQREHIASRLETLRNRITETKKSLHKHEQAREVIKQIGHQTQQKIRYHIGNITSMALETVFNSPYELVLEFVERRNKTECDIYFTRDGYKVDPIEESGGGAIDVAAFALRIASWSMTMPHTRNIAILDEPFKHLKGAKENEQVLDMIKEISNKLGIQIITVSDERIDRSEIALRADKMLITTIENGVSEFI